MGKKKPKPGSAFDFDQVPLMIREVKLTSTVHTGETPESVEITAKCKLEVPVLEVEQLLALPWAGKGLVKHVEESQTVDSNEPNTYTTRIKRKFAKFDLLIEPGTIPGAEPINVVAEIRNQPTFKVVDGIASLHFNCQLALNLAQLDSIGRLVEKDANLKMSTDPIGAQNDLKLVS